VSVTPAGAARAGLPGVYIRFDLSDGFRVGRQALLFADLTEFGLQRSDVRIDLRQCLWI
jgi:hypothetical protein